VKFMEEGIVSAIGNTPLVQLKKMFPNAGFELFAKLEFLNPGGSAKDRPALNMIREGLKSGEINRDTVIIESSSGNLAISLVKICAYYGIRFICVVDPKTTRQNLRILKAYNAEIEFVAEPDPETGEFLPARLKRVQSLLERYRNSYWTNQYANMHNAMAHYKTTMKEIAQQLNTVDYLFCGVSSCGTIRGCAEYVRDHRLQTRIVAVDARGSVIFGGDSAKRLLPGLGAGIVPPLKPTDNIYKIVQVSDWDCVTGCHELVRKEQILAGGSSGGVIKAVERMRHEIPEGARCAVILPDRGERYLDTIYSDEWLQEYFGDASSGI
jgi:2,3-diaminopropionate biosynthesis protein SbnA